LSQISRLAKRLAAFAIVAGSLLVAAPHASASEQACRYDSRTFNACLSFDSLGSGFYDAHVGLDVTMPEQYAREIIACGGRFQATLWGDDGGFGQDDRLRDLSVAPGWPVAGPNGLGVEFIARDIPRIDLDEDSGTDEVAARISYLDCHTQSWRQYATGTIVRSF
jgi:hypothetical protein